MTIVEIEHVTKVVVVVNFNVLHDMLVKEIEVKVYDELLENLVCKEREV